MFTKQWYRAQAGKMTVNLHDDVTARMAKLGYTDPQTTVTAQVNGYLSRGEGPTGVFQVWATRDTWGGTTPTPEDWATCVVLDVHYDVQDEAGRTVTAYLFKHQPQDR